MTSPLPPDQPQPAVEVTQLGLGLADTPAGQRVVLTMSMLLSAADAKKFAEQLTAIAGQMSGTGLVVASGVLNGGHVG